MQLHVLPEGTILDERYRIDSLLGEGGFGITYAASRIVLNQKVAIKELFWRDHCVRDAAASPQIALRSAEDEPVFSELKERFLREARITSDFSDQPGIAHVQDYFEANGTAYIVLEYVDGETLSAYVAKHGAIPPEDLFRRFIPLAESLSFIHKNNVIHRDISPDNIMVQPDGSLKLIDFGAAREYTVPTVSSVVVKVSYAPPEQHDRKGELGPWTDIYSLCATLYFCVTGEAPVDSIQRMFVDDLKAPSVLKRELEQELKRGYEAVILRGMELIAANRWQNMDELANAMRRALPAPPPPPRPWLYALLAVLGVVIVAGGILWWTNRDRPKFDCVTETFYLIPPGNQYVEDFAQAQLDLKDSLDAFAGKDNYIITPTGSELHVELPLDLFEERDIGAVLSEKLEKLLEKYDFSFTYQIQVDWDDPTASMFEGKNQIRSEEFTDETAIFSYGIPDDNLTAGQRANLLMDFKTRLDALDTPYAFGTTYGNPNEIVYRIDPGRIGRCVTETIGDPYPLQLEGEMSMPSHTVSFDSSGDRKLAVIDNGDGTFGLRYEVSEYYAEEIQKLTKTLLDSGQSTLFLQTATLGNALPLAKIDLQAPITDGVVEFQDFMFDGLEKIDAGHRYILDYLATLVNDTKPPCLCSRHGEGIWNPENGGILRFDEPVEDHFSLFTTLKDGNVRMRELLIRISKETDYDCAYSNGTFWIQLHIPSDTHQIERIAEIVPDLLKKYSFSDIICDSTVTIQLKNEYGSERYRIILNTGYDSDSGRIYHYAMYAFSDFTSAEPLPYSEEFNAWWDSFPIEDYGFTKG